MTVWHFVLKQREKHGKLNVYTLLLYLDLAGFLWRGVQNAICELNFIQFYSLLIMNLETHRLESL